MRVVPPGTCSLSLSLSQEQHKGYILLRRCPGANETQSAATSATLDQQQQMDTNSHTVVLIQYNHMATSRTYLDYETLPAALDAVCGLYEKELKTLNPKVRNITYDIADLYAYLDQLQDLSCLVFNQQMNAYLPRGKDWIKQQVFHHLRRQAQGA